MKKLVVPVCALVLALLLSVSSVSNTHAATNFKDVPEGYWAEKEIEYLVQEGIITGYDDGTFKPEKTVTRLQAATMLVRALGLDTNNRPDPGFKDIQKGDYGYEYVAAVVDEGIFSKAENFNPHKPLTRGQMAKILVKAFGLQGDCQGEIIDVPKEFESYVRALAANGITKLYNDNTYKPNEIVKRAHFAVFFARAKNPQFRVKNLCLKKINLSNPYDHLFMLFLDKDKNKMFIIGGEPQELVVKEGNSTKVIIPASEEIGYSYLFFLGETENKLYIESQHYSTRYDESSKAYRSEIDEERIYIVDKKTNKYEKKSKDEFYAPFKRMIEEQGYAASNISWGPTYIQNNGVMWVVAQKPLEYKDGEVVTTGVTFIMNSNGIVKVLEDKKDDHIDYYIKRVINTYVDQQGNFYYVDQIEHQLIKIDSLGVETNYDIPDDMILTDIMLIDNRNNVYTGYQVYRDGTWDYDRGVFKISNGQLTWDYDYDKGKFKVSNGQLELIKNLPQELNIFALDVNGNAWYSKGDIEEPYHVFGYIDSSYIPHDLYVLEGSPFSWGFDIYNDVILVYTDKGYGLFPIEAEERMN